MRDFTEDDPPAPSPVFKVWAAYVTHDSGGRGAIIGIFTEKDGAKVAARKRGSWGGDGDVGEVHCVRVGEAVYLLERPDAVVLNQDLEKYKQAIRDEALAKLTHEEQVALGLK